MIKEFKIIEKKKLTYDIFEIVFETEKKFKIKAGQFITFILPKIGGRAYSILKQNGNKTTLIIKKWELENGGRGGSKYICEREIGESLKGVGPAGHFVLQENEKNKLFLGTGTGFVPLYNQIIGNIENKINNKIKLIFGVRTKKDLFYIDKLENLKKENTNFDFEIYLSKEKTENFNMGYITDFLTKQNLKNFEEFYICGAPAMIDSSNEILKNLGKENIYFEKY